MNGVYKQKEKKERDVMKTVEFRKEGSFEVTIPQSGGTEITEKLTYPNLMVQALDTPPPGGFDRATSRDRNKVVAKIEEAVEDKKESVELEDAEMAVLYQAVMDWHIGVRHPGFDKFWDYIEEVQVDSQTD